VDETEEKAPPFLRSNPDNWLLWLGLFGFLVGSAFILNFLLSGGEKRRREKLIV